jgi:hypothetical protein
MSRTPVARSLSFLTLTALMACTAADAPPDAVTLTELPAASAELAEPFTAITGATELASGQVVVVDGSDAEVTVVDFAAARREALGKRGAGPGEYTAPAGILRLLGDTVVVLDVGGGGGGSARLVRFNPDRSAGATGNMMLLDLTDTSVVQGTMFAGADGEVYSTAVKLRIGPSGPAPSDTMQIVRFPLSTTPQFTKLAQIRTPQTGEREQQIEGTAIKIRAPFPGLVTADAWTAFPDGRVAIIRGEGYTVEFRAPDGTVSPPVAIPYDRIPVTAEDQEAELASTRQQLADAMVMIRRTLPPGVTLDIEVVPPPSWPKEYPPIVAIVAYPDPAGNVWVRRATRALVDREQWDVIGPTGQLTARWLLPPAVRLVAVGNGAVYTTRTDEDDLQYLQRVTLPR